MNPIIHTISCLVLLAQYTVCQLPSNSITCYRCNNGYITLPKCVNAPAEGLEKGVSVVKSSVDDECMTVSEFFAKHNLITNEWMKRSLMKKKGRLSEAEDSENTNTTTTMQAYCATIILFATNHESIPQTYRDCIKGTPREVKKNFMNTFDFAGDDFGLPDTGGPNKCTKKRIKSERGTKAITVCLCQSDKCNKDNAKNSSPKNAQVYSLLLSFLISYTQ